MALAEDEQPSPAWWHDRLALAELRSGGLPTECAALPGVDLLWESDPESDEEYVRISLPLPAETTLGRARELCHLLSSVFVSEGYTLRLGDQVIEDLPGERLDQPKVGTFGDDGYETARVCAQGCMDCVIAGGGGVGCCSEGGSFSLPDLGAALIAGADELVADILSRPGRVDGDKWEPHMVDGRCVYHDRSTGCTLPRDRMPLQCRIYLCLPERLLPGDLLAQYDAYEDRLERMEDFIAEQMRSEGVDFDSPLAEMKAAATRAFAAWEAKRSA